MAAFLVTRASWSAPGLVVETGSPDVTCPRVAATRAAVHDRLAGVAIDTKGWTARYVVLPAHAGEGDLVVLVLRDEAGAIRLERRLPLAGEPCEAVISAMALVVERYFRELEAPAGPEETTAAPSPALPGQRSAPATPDRAAALRLSRPVVLQLALETGLAWGSRRAVFSVDVGYWFLGWLQASLQPALLLPPRSETVVGTEASVRGSVQAHELPVRLAIGLGRSSERVSWYMGPAVRASVRRARSEQVTLLDDTGQEVGTSDVGWSLAAGAGAGLTYWLLPAVGVTARVALDAQVTETAFRVRSASGAPRQVLISASPEGQALFGVAWGASR